jgi:acetyltransferase-like isoleucine patch superfamily enzyme
MSIFQKRKRHLNKVVTFVFDFIRVVSLQFKLKRVTFENIAVFKSMYYSFRFRGVILIGKKVNIILNKNSRINVSNNGAFKIGLKYISPNYTTLFIGDNSTLYVYSAEIMRGCQIVIMENAHLYLGYDSFINENTTIEVRNKVVIGNGCAIAKNNYITDSDIHKVIENGKEKIFTKPIVIKNKVWIGLNTIVLKGVTLDNNSIVAAGSVVVKDVASGTIVAGNPAKEIKRNVSWDY